MTNKPSFPFLIDDLRRDLSTPDQRSLLAWGKRQFYVAFWRLASGAVRPAIMKEQGRHYYVCSPHAEVVEWLLTQPPFEKAVGEVQIKPHSLAELARNARYQKLGIYLSDGEVGFCFFGHMLALWGETIILEDEQNQEIIYRAAEIFTFDTTDDLDSPPRGAVQYWHDSTLNDLDERKADERRQSIYVFDDQWDWDSPRLPTLPDNAYPQSSLSPDAQAFFKHIKGPLLPSPEPERDTPPADVRYQNALIDASNTASFNQLWAMVERELVPAANAIKLTVKEVEASTDESNDTLRPWEVSIHYVAPTGHQALFYLGWIEPDLLQANAELPNTTGIHCVSEALRASIVNHLAWHMFYYSRTFVKTFFSNALEGVLPCSVSNRYAHFQPNYSDSRFPCIACFCCGMYQVPVLLLGQADSLYIGIVLEEHDIPAEEVPTTLPQRSELLNSRTGSLMLHVHCQLALPTSLVDLPAHWYRGVRISNGFLRDKFILDMRFSIMSTPPEALPRNNTSQLFTITIIVVLIALVIFATLR